MITKKDQLGRFQLLSQKAGTSMTAQKRAVLEALVRREDHPTAEQIFEDVRTTLPDVSRATVYRILNTLLEMEIARKVHHPGDFARFETKVDRHHHLVCRKCEKIEDVDDSALKTLQIPRALPSGVKLQAGFEFQDYSVNFFGLCSKCKTKVTHPRRTNS